jgi:hypothetical protein
MVPLIAKPTYTGTAKDMFPTEKRTGTGMFFLFQVSHQRFYTFFILQ